MIKEGKNKFFLSCDVYRHPVTLFVNVPFEEVQKHLAKCDYEHADEEDERENAKCAGVCIQRIQRSTKKKSTAVWVGEFKKNVECMGTLAHEILHAALTILQEVGVDAGSNEAEEATAYLFEHLYRQALEKLKVFS